MVVAATATIVIMKTSSQNNESNVNLYQVQNAGNWISRDALMAQVIDTNKSGVFLNIRWSDWDGNNFSVDYIITGDHMMMRQLNGGTATLIAEYIVPAGTVCQWEEAQNKLTVTIRASMSGGGYAERTYEICPRPVAIGG